MDVEKKTSVNGLWTNQKHVSYLSQMEAAFVRKMRERHDARSVLTYTSVHQAPPPLDRYLPDSFESNRDSKRQRNNTQEINDKIGVANDGTNNQKKRIMRRRYSRPHDASRDQVVPQLGKVNCKCKSDKDEESGNY